MVRRVTTRVKRVIPRVMRVTLEPGESPPRVSSHRKIKRVCRVIPRYKRVKRVTPRVRRATLKVSRLMRATSRVRKVNIY